MKSNLYRKLRTLGFTAGLVCVSMYAMTNAGGPPAENTGAPGDATCGQAGCHSFSPIQSGTQWNNITFTSTIPTSGYVPGNTYSITLAHVQPNHSVFGFQAVMLDQNHIQAGSFTSGTGTATQTANGRVYINHTTGGTSGLGGKNWSFSWTAPASGMGTLTLYVAINAANGDATNSGDTIFTKGFTIYQTGTAPPTASFTMDNDTVCQNDTVRFTGSATNNPTSYSWTIPGSTFINGTTAGSQNPVVIFNSTFAGSSVLRGISLAATNNNGMSQPFTGSVLVNALPSITTTPSGANNSICGNDSVALSAASGTYSYLWTPGNLTTQTIYAKNTGSFTVKLTNTQTGCARSSAAVGFVKRNLPVVTLSSNTDTICIGDSVTLSATAGMVNYQFYADTTQIYSGNTANIKVSPASSAVIYTVYGTDANGCKSLVSNNKQIQVQTPLPAPTVSCDSVSQTSIRFMWTSVSGADGYEVSLDSGKTWIAPSSGSTGLTHEVTGLAAATRKALWARATQATGKCSKGLHGATSCQTTGCIAVTYSLVYDSTTCNPGSNDSVSVDVTNISTGSFQISVDEVTAAGVFVKNIYASSTATSFKLKLNGTNNVYYRFSVLDLIQNTCPAGVKTITVKGIVAPAADPVMTFSKATNVLCDRDSATFTFTKPTGTDLFELYKGATLLGTTGNTSLSLPAAIFSNGDIVYVSAVDTNTGCARSSADFTIQRKADPKAGFTFTKDTTSVQFTDTTANSKSWSWKFGDNGTSTIKNPLHTYASGGTFTVSLSVVTNDDCASDTASQSITISVGLSTIDGIGFMQYFPNPVKSQMGIDLHINQVNQEVLFVVRDLQGKVVKVIDAGLVTTRDSHHQLDLNDLQATTYLMEVKVGSLSRSFNFIKE